MCRRGAVLSEVWESHGVGAVYTSIVHPQRTGVDTERKVMPTREEVYIALSTERSYQDAQRGNAKRHEGMPAMTPGEYLLCMEKCLQDARGVWYRPDGSAECLEHVRKVAALGVAVMELYGAPHRQ